jgi:predicted MPP superfamily phosphohydrolase
MMTRRRFLVTLAGTASTGLGALGYSKWVEPRWTQVVWLDMPVPGLPPTLAGRTLAHISDLHVGTTDPDHLARCLRLVSSLAPDLVVVTGDLMTCDGAEQVDCVPAFMAHLETPPLGCFAVLGNHDYGAGWRRADVADLLAARLSGCGVRVLRNEVAEVHGLQVAGLDELWAGRCRPADAVGRLDPSRPALALCHNPDVADEPGWGEFRGWILAGHTHGGQCKPPFLPPPVTHLRNPRYVAGAFDLGGGRRLYVNRGLGYVRKVRFNARPEVTLFRLVPTLA